MGVRITELRQGDHTALRVAGRLLAEDVDVLLAAVSGAGASTLLDFTDLQGTDEAGLRAIMQLVNEGSAIVAASPQLKLRLQRLQERRPESEE